MFDDFPGTNDDDDDETTCVIAIDNLNNHITVFFRGSCVAFRDDAADFKLHGSESNEPIQGNVHNAFNTASMIVT
jgi:hypothetical protein